MRCSLSDEQQVVPFPVRRKRQGSSCSYPEVHSRAHADVIRTSYQCGSLEGGHTRQLRVTNLQVMHAPGVEFACVPQALVRRLSFLSAKVEFFSRLSYCSTISIFSFIVSFFVGFGDDLVSQQTHAVVDLKTFVCPGKKQYCVSSRCQLCAPQADGHRSLTHHSVQRCQHCTAGSK